jgi:endonuclease YncB( thermonuclease family)
MFWPIEGIPVPIGKTRRIFIHRPRRRIGAHTLRIAAALVFLGAGAAGGAKISTVLSNAVIGSIAPPVRAAVQARRPMALSGEHAAVIDGETLRLSGQVIRLDGVAAPQRGQSCRLATDCAGAAAGQLAELVHDRRVACTVNGADKVGRAVGSCQAGGTNINEAVVQRGWAVAEANQPNLLQAQAIARSAHRGLWSTP